MNKKFAKYFVLVCVCALAGFVIFRDPHNGGDCGDHCMIPLLTGDIETESESAFKTAPQLAVRQWIQGPEVQITPGRAMIVEFWEPWCKPCLLVIPHMDELYRKHKDRGLDVVGLSGENPVEVRGLIRQKGDKMSYPVAIASKDDYANYFGNAGQIGIPYAFVIDRGGKIIWEGSPLNPEMIAPGPGGTIVAGGYPYVNGFDEAVEKALEM